MILKIALSIIGILLLLLVAGRINIVIKFKKQVEDLFKRSGNISHIKYDSTQLISLPEPLQRYFKYVLNNGQPYISYARIKHTGTFKTGIDKPWIKITGEQYATTETPGFIWKGTTAMFVARDMYINNQGRLLVHLFFLYTVADAMGKQFDQGELLRWLGESVLYPTNLLPGERLIWSAIDTNTAKLRFNYNGLSLYFIITVNEIGEITQMETRRYMDEKTLATWVIKMEKYKTFDNIQIPTVFDVMWRLDAGDFSYAKFNIIHVEYNVPHKF